MLEARAERGDVGVREGGFEGVEDDAVGAVADRVHVLTGGEFFCVLFLSLGGVGDEG